MADQIFKKRQGEKRKRKEATRQIQPYRYLIVCEGSKTEPNYFEGIREQIHKKYGRKVRVSKINAERIEIDGTGRNTEDLVKYAIRKRRDAEIPYGHVWCVFDRDSFTDQQFNNAIVCCKSNNIGAAWSNESIELWFLLHFEYLNTGISREQYVEKLNRYFELYNINQGKYEKNIPDIYKNLVKFGSLDNAIKNARKLTKMYNDEDTSANRNPSTMVYQLVEELFEYL
ncbi:RloB family protein [Fusibacter tunisiensis]|uniref:RloB domain-containing protein n=1 Tax=Fusibacter tunisiensis TaxID=1008308 RepID=A0ABS2MNC6_9FIRM|nr:RloB family protein [Fusibacter tunisiensis]MBM7560911.1 hypothetical protein [Fusibacter tunisiensis]